MTEDLFKENCNRWSLYHQKSAHQLKESTPQRVKICKNPNGSLNLATQIAGETKYFHQEDPEEEAKAAFRSLELHGIKVLFVYGVGLGYFYDAVKEWLKGDEGRSLVFLEDDLEVLYHLFSTVRGKEILHDSQVWVALVDEATLSTLSEIYVYKTFKVAGLEFYNATRKEFFDQLKAKIAFYMNLRIASTTEYSDHGRAFFTNFFNNLLLLPDAALAPKLYGQFPSVPAIICGAGPSLAKNLPVLATLRDHALIFAGGTAMNALNTIGLLPHFGVGIDPNPAQFTRLIMNQAFEIPFLYRNRLLNKALKLIHGKHLYVTGSGGYTISEWFEEKLGIRQSTDVEEGCNVVNFSLALAYAFGCNPIVLVGVDLAYTNEKSYTPGILNHPIHSRKEYFGTKSPDEDIIVKPDIYGQPTYTLWKWVAESVWFSNFVRLNKDRTFVNATEGGIGFAGIPNYPLAEVAENLLPLQYDFDGMIAEKIAHAALPLKSSKQAIEEVMRTFFESLDRSENLCRTIQKECEATERKIKFDMEAPPLSEIGLKALSDLEQEPAYTHLLKVFSDYHLRLHKRDYHSLRTDALKSGPKEIELKKANLNAARYAFLRETAKVNRNILERVLQEAADNEMQRLMRGKEESPKSPLASSETYTAQDGKLTILDPELNLNIIEPFTPDPESGIIRSHYSNGKLSSEQFYFKNQLHGPSTFYGEEGAILSQSWFVRGKRQGKARVFASDGKLQSLQRFREGVWDGLQEFYYPDGQVKALLPYHEGRLHGHVRLYYPHGQLKRELQFVEGARDGIERIWNETGLLVIEAEFEKDKPVGKAREWYSNGNMALEIIYEKDSRNFTIREWDESGFPSLTEKRIRGDYFDQVAQQAGKLTDTLSMVLEQIKSLNPLVNQIAHTQEIKSETKSESYVPMDMDALKKEIDDLKKISEELLAESGFRSAEGDEMFWKGPAARREVEKEVQTMTVEISKNINKVQNNLVITLGKLAKKMKQEEEKGKAEEEKAKPKEGSSTEEKPEHG